MDDQEACGEVRSYHVQGKFENVGGRNIPQERRIPSNQFVDCNNHSSSSICRTVVVAMIRILLEFTGPSFTVCR